jgi:hypothetical protein
LKSLGCLQQFPVNKKPRIFQAVRSLSDAQPKNINDNNDKFAELLQQLTLNKKHHLVTAKRLLDASKTYDKLLQQIVAKTSFCNKLLQTINRHFETVRLWLWMLQKMTTTTNFLSFFATN